VTHVIGEACIGTTDRSCVAVCPVDCIHDAGKMFVIDPVECIDCGACIQECPVEAIRSDTDLSPEWEPFVGINAAWVDGGPEAAAGLLRAHLRAGS
jgi:NAD-dependent dihydropyrimidine dehydrogenase PreA subunit